MLVRVGESGTSGDAAGVTFPPILAGVDLAEVDLAGVDFFALRAGVCDFSVGVDEGALLTVPGTSSKESSSGVSINVTAPMVKRITIKYMTNVLIVDGSNAMPKIISGVLFVIVD